MGIERALRASRISSERGRNFPLGVSKAERFEEARIIQARVQIEIADRAEAEEIDLLARSARDSRVGVRRGRVETK